MDHQFKLLFTPIKIGTMELKNRLVMPPMVTNYATIGGAVTDRLITHYATRATGGVGLIDVEATAIDPRGKLSSYNLCLHDDAMIPGLRGLAEAIHQGGAKAAIEIAHAGRQTSKAIVGVQPVAPSAIPYGGGEVPRELGVGEIQDLVEAFAQAARRAKEAGFDAVNFHMAHGYLVNQFLSPHPNKRTDEYGGNLENRARFAVEIIKRTRELVGSDYPLLSRINGADLVDGGLTIEEGKAIAQILEKAGLNALDVSAAMYENPEDGEGPMAQPRGYLTHLSAAVKQVVSIPVLAVGRINDPILADQLLVEGKADLVNMGRALLADPDLPRKAAAGRLEDICPCIACNEGCIERLDLDLTITCTVNPLLGREAQFPIAPAEKPRRVLVAGGGPGGMEAALVAAQRGHKVTLCEKQAELGGLWNLSGVPPYKEEVRNLVPYLRRELAKAGVEILTNREVNRALIEQLKPEAVVVATGSKPTGLDIPGADGDNVVPAWDVLRGQARVGKQVVVIGGGEVGLETAEYLADQGKEVAVLEMQGAVAQDMGTRARNMLLDRLPQKGVNLIVSATATAFEGSAVFLDRAGLSEKLQGVDTIVLATGARPDTTVADQLEGLGYEVHLIGDCARPRKGLEAMLEGFAVGRAI